MARFNTVEDVKRVFRSKSNGSDTIEKHAGLRYGDIDKHAPIIEQLLKTDYNKISGFSFSEVCEAISHLQTQFGTRTYLNDCINNGVAVSEALYNGIDLSKCEDNYFSAVSEAFEAVPSTAQQAPYPVPSISFVTYRYEKSVLPFLCHLFDLKGNRGLIYFQKIHAVNGLGNIKAGDVLGDARNMPAQPVGFATTHVASEDLGSLTVGAVEFTATLAQVPQPGTLVVTINGHTGYFKDFQEGMAKENVAILTPVGENLGYATFDYAEKKLSIKLAEAPLAENQSVKATYNRDVETKEGGKERQAKFTMEVEAKHIVTENISIYTETTVYQEALSRAIFGLDWNAEVDKAMGMLYNKEMANKVVSEISAVIPAKNIVSHDITATLNTTGTGDNKLFNVKFLAGVLGVLKKRIAKSAGIPITRFSTFVINVDLLPVFEMLDKFTPANALQEDQMGGMFLGGIYDGTPVVVAYEPIVGPGEIIGLYKAQTQDFLTPYVLGTFMEPVIRDLYDHDNLAINKKQMIATIGGECVAENLTAKLVVNGIDDLFGVVENEG